MSGTEAELRESGFGTEQPRPAGRGPRGGMFQAAPVWWRARGVRLRCMLGSGGRLEGR